MKSGANLAAMQEAHGVDGVTTSSIGNLLAMPDLTGGRRKHRSIFPSKWSYLILLDTLNEEVQDEDKSVVRAGDSRSEIDTDT
jgi:hypothetical protein